MVGKPHASDRHASDRYIGVIDVLGCFLLLSGILVYTFYASRTEFQVHQFKPVLKFLASQDQRLLLADEVGLGKTIEAAIVI